jgi:hypothetical protein
MIRFNYTRQDVLLGWEFLNRYRLVLDGPGLALEIG